MATGFIFLSSVTLNGNLDFKQADVSKIRGHTLPDI